MTRTAVLVFAVVLTAAAPSLTAQEPEPRLDDVLAKASAYVRDYEARFSLLVADEHYVQEIRRPDNNPVAGNLSRNNPGGGFASNGGVRKRLVLKSDYLLVQLGPGAGWMPFRDTYEVNGKTVNDRDDRLARLFLEPTETSLDMASRLMTDSTRHNLGSMTRTVNIPTLALMFLHPEVRERFTFSKAGVDTLGGRPAWRLEYTEHQHPTLIRTTRGRDLPATGRLWIDPSTGVVMKTQMVAADPLVRAMITTTYQRDAALDMWVPATMEDYYKADAEVDEVTGTATYGRFRRFNVSTDAVMRRPPQ